MYFVFQGQEVWKFKIRKSNNKNHKFLKSRRFQISGFYIEYIV